ncbi:MAG: hypothetical protein H7138_09995 [Myxococcales bacterium]|nr:hypothetical protein [Myxococcales bacterium]
MGTQHLQLWPRVPRRLTNPKTSLWWNLEISARRVSRQGDTVILWRVLQEQHDARDQP